MRRFLREFRLIRLSVLLGSRLRVGRNVSFGAGAVLLPPSFAHFGDNVSIGRDFHLETNLHVGSDVLISSRVAIVGNDHTFDVRGTTIYWSGRRSAATVTIEGDNLLGFGVIIVGNVRIGRGCIVGAGAVVTADLPPDMVCAGIPARPIKPRYA